MKVINHNLKDYLAIIVVLFVAIVISLLTGFNMPSYWGVPILILCMSTSFLLHWIAFIPAFYFKTEKFYDILGTFAYLSIILISLFLTKKISGENISFRSLIIAVLVIVWALRLGLFLLFRVLKSGEDRRFREPMKSCSKFLLWWSMSALWVFLTTINAITTIVNNYSSINDLFLYIGLSIWSIGFVFELISDEQKRRFKNKPENKGRFISSGLWHLSRHPNYFGEITIWFGISIISLPTLTGLQFVSLISPIFVYFLLTRISGINLLEQQADHKWGNSKEYQAYKKQTPSLIPFTK